MRRFLRYLQASIPPGADGQVWWLTLVVASYAAVPTVEGLVALTMLEGVGFAFLYPAWCFGVTSVILMVGANGLAIALAVSRRREAGLPGAG